MSDASKPWEDLIRPSPLTGSEPIGTSGVSVLDYWRWSGSDLLSNTARGIFAEFLVAQAVGDRRRVRDGWAVHDVTMPAGDGHPEIKIEVKSGAYLQSWKQSAYSTIQFGRLRSRAWLPETNELEPEPAYHGDVYVFAVLDCKDPSRIDPTDLAQWDFRVIPQKTLEALGTRSISWTTVQRLAPERVEWGDLARSVREAARTA